MVPSRQHDRKRLARVGLFFLAFTIVLGSADAEETTLFMAGMEMKLGMPREVLLGKLKENFKLTDTGDDYWTIFEKGDPPLSMVGIIGFKEGKLSWISKDWGSFHTDGSIELAKELFSLFSSLAAEGQGLALISPKSTVHQPGLTANQIEVLFEKKKILITITEIRSKSGSVSIQEIIQSKQ